MGRAKRCRTVVLSASVAALGTAGACPQADAAPRQESAAPATAPVVAQAAQRLPRRKPAYVYRFQLAANEGDMRADCGGPLPVIRHALLRPVSANTIRMLGTVRAERAEHVVTVSPSATLRVVGDLRGEVKSVCAVGNGLASNANAVVEPGVFTWRLSKPAYMAAEVLSHPATETEVVAYNT